MELNALTKIKKLGLDLSGGGNYLLLQFFDEEVSVCLRRRDWLEFSSNSSSAQKNILVLYT